MRIDPERVKARFGERVPARLTAALLVGIGTIFYLLWLSEIIPPLLDGTIPDTVKDAGLPTNPVHVLDLSLLLPTTLLAGVLLTKCRSCGYVLAPLVLVAMVFISLGIVSLMAVLALRDLEASAGVGVGIAVMGLLEMIVVARFLRTVDRAADVKDVLRGSHAE